MRSRFQDTAVLLVASTLFFRLARPQSIANLPACGQTCWNNGLGEAGKLGCDQAQPLACLCAKSDFGFAIRDCAAQNCGGDAALAVSVTSFASSVCASATAATPAATTTTPPPPPPTTTTPPPPPPTTTSSTVSPTQQSTGTAPSSSTTSTSMSSTSSGTTSSAASSSTTSSQTSAATAASSSDTSSASTPPTLSIAAKAGIGVAAAVGLAFILALVLCLLARRRHANKVNRAQSMQISDPLPGSGRNYAQGVAVAGKTGKKMTAPGSSAGMSELDQRSRRYEDMIPRQTPRHMV